MYYKLGQACVTNWGSFVLLQIRANFVTNWGSFSIKNWGSYYRLGQTLLRNRGAITNRGITPCPNCSNLNLNQFLSHFDFFVHFQGRNLFKRKQLS